MYSSMLRSKLNQASKGCLVFPIYFPVESLRGIESASSDGEEADYADTVAIITRALTQDFNCTNNSSFA